MRKGMRLWPIGFLLVCLSLVLFGCGTGGSEEAGKKEEGSASEGAGDKKKFIVGTDATYAPMEYMDSSGNIIGIDIDIVKAVAEEVGAEVEFKNVGWEPLFPAVKNGEVDFAVSSITMTEERKKEFDFTDPYYIANQVILIPEDSDISKLEDLKDKKASVQINTTGHEVLKELMGNTSANIIAAETMPLAIEEMLNGNADAAVGDNSVVNEYLKNNPDKKLKVIEDESFEKEYYGLMVKKGNQELRDLLNEGIKKIKENGKLKEITGYDVE